MRHLGVLTSGGDAPGMNACIRAVVRTAVYHGIRVTGIRYGYEGILNDNFVAMDSGSVGDIIHRGGTILMTARSNSFMETAGQDRAAERLRIAGIDGLVVIGGDGSFRGAQTLHKRGIAVACIPGTIDNDIAGTEYTIGFDTAVNTVLDAINKIRDTATSHGRINMIEVMGHRSGHIALHAGFAGGAESILVPEEPFDLEAVCTRLIRGRERGKKHSIILIAEGAGDTMEIGKAIEKKTGQETRVTILGHIQRGGNPTALDRLWASRMGARAVERLQAGHSGEMLAVQQGRLVAVDLDAAATTSTGLDQDLYDLAGILSL
ncbi:6-phosphofructokinase [Heliophilum fasciatum]|uniref:6-phosphofructokinase n=1 Tax=Heliophilum fasciatum TaxID=35700 RepID=UPI00104612D5|nr:6-phosphofructokinase [Heliophilum fasciatum]